MSDGGLYDAVMSRYRRLMKGAGRQGADARDDEAKQTNWAAREGGAYGVYMEKKNRGYANNRGRWRGAYGDNRGNVSRNKRGRRGAAVRRQQREETLRLWPLGWDVRGCTTTIETISRGYKNKRGR